jgi:hypothetical protein
VLVVHASSVPVWEAGHVTGYDAEWQLCRRAEDDLLAGRPVMLHERARALVAVGLLTPERAAAVVGRYRRAGQLRGLEDPREHHRGYRPFAATLSPPRVTECGQTIELPWGTVTLHYVISTREQTAITVRLTPASRPRDPHRPQAASPMPSEPNLTVTDDRGVRHATEYSPSPGDDHWSGRYVLAAPLPAHTKWITVFDQRIELAAEADDVSVLIEKFDPDVGPAELAERHLNRCLEALSTPSYRYQEAVPLAVDTFVDAGILDGNSEVVKQVAAAAQLLHGESVAPGELSPRWQSVQARRAARDGRLAAQAIGAITPYFDDLRVALLAVRSSPSDLELDFAAAAQPGSESIPLVGDSMFTITATDDRGNEYIGGFTEFNNGAEGMRGLATFNAPVDPHAARLDIRLATDRAQATVRVPLRWEDSS